MANRITFDPTEEPTAEAKVAEQAAYEQGEKLIQAQEEDRARKFEQAEAEQEEVSLIGGKFKSQDDLLKAYNELQKKMGQDAPDEEEDASAEPVEATEEGSDEEEKPQIDEHVKSFVEISQRFDANGGLTEDDVATLSAMDSKQLVETYFKYHALQTKRAQQEQATQAQLKSIRDSVGGDEAYAEMITWASENLEPAEIEQFNAVVNTNNAAALRFAVDSLNNKFRAQEGYEAPLVTGKKAASKGKVFRSQAELARAISDPRYQSDPAYRMDVEEKLARSGDLL